MWHTTTEDFNRQYEKLPQKIRAKFDKQVLYLDSNFRHPSLQAKKYGGSEDVFQARVDQFYRFYFKINGDCYIIFNIIHHPK